MSGARLARVRNSFLLESHARYGAAATRRSGAWCACEGGRRRNRPGRAPLHAYQYRPGTAGAVADSREVVCVWRGGAAIVRPGAAGACGRVSPGALVRRAAASGQHVKARVSAAPATVQRQPAAPCPGFSGPAAPSRPVERRPCILRARSPARSAWPRSVMPLPSSPAGRGGSSVSAVRHEVLDGNGYIPALDPAEILG